jgi:hypothetical protein
MKQPFDAQCCRGDQRTDQYMKALETLFEKDVASSCDPIAGSRVVSVFISVCLILLSMGAGPAWAQAAPEQVSPEAPALVKAAMCEDIQDFAPQNEALVFSVTNGRVCCFTRFDSVQAELPIVHNWFHRDRAITSRKLFLKPPAWATYSSIQLRESDKGPWRVEITDPQGNLLAVVRFSVVD